MKFTFRTTEPWPGVKAEDWNSWTWQFRNGLTKAEDFAKVFDLTDSEREAFARGTGFQVRSTPYYAALADSTFVDDPIRRMIVPRAEELASEGQQVSDPLGERKHSPRERLIHRYPDRVLFLVTDQCSLYCRYCLRKHFTGQEQAFVGSKDYESALTYLRGATGVREVILSGGDPMTLSDGRLERVLFDLRAIEHIEIIRIGTRMPVVCPQRISEETVKMIRRFKPVYLMTHFNHPRELSAEGATALERFVDHGIPSFNQMVLLNGINNHAAIVQALSRRLLFLRVKPYYMFQCDPSEGSEHFRTSIDNSRAIQRELWGRLSGLAMPNLSMDVPGGGGKVGFVPDFEIAKNAEPYVQVAKNGELPQSGIASSLSEEKITRSFSGWDNVVGVYQNPTATVEPELLEPYLTEWNALKNQTYGK